MTQYFKEDGTVVPVTRVVAGPCFVTVKKDYEKDGYRSVQLAWGEKKEKNTNKALRGFFKKLNLANAQKVKEFRLDKDDTMFEKINAGEKIDVGIFQAGDIAKIQGISKGKGFQGVVKRHGFSGSPASHGHKDQLRMPGSVGATGPARVFKGTRMGGRMGGENVTVFNLEIVDVKAENNELFIKGAVPGAYNSEIFITAEGEFEPQKTEEKKDDKNNNQEEKATKEKQENDNDKKSNQDLEQSPAVAEQNSEEIKHEKVENQEEKRTDNEEKKESK